MATKNIVPRANGEGNLGTEQKKWNKIYVNDVVLADGAGLNAALAAKLDKNQGAENAGKSLVVDEHGNVVLGDGGGHLVVPAIPSPAEAKEKVVYFVFDAAHNKMIGYILHDNKMVEIGQSNGVPVGMITAWGGTIDNIPVGFLRCNGASVLRATYPDLFAKIGTNFGAVDDLHFNLPSANDARYLCGGSVVGVMKEAGLPNITGEVNASGGVPVIGLLRSYSGAFSTSEYNAEYFVDQGIKLGTPAGGNLRIDASRSSSIYGNSDTVTPKSVTVIFIIKAFGGADESVTDVGITQLSDEIVGLAGRTDVVAQGDGYIRYINGLQMCWGVTIATRNARHIPYSMPFASEPCVNLTDNSGQKPVFAIAPYLNDFILYCTVSEDIVISYLAIGMWK